MRATRCALAALVLCLPGQSLVGCAPTGEQKAFAPEDAPAGTYLKLGKSLLLANEPELAFDAFIASIRLDGVSAEALTGAGIASQKQGLLTAARRYFEQAVELDPTSVTANNNLGVVLFLMNEYYPARDAFRAAYALSSGRSEIAERNLNRTEAVVAQIEEARQEDPETSHRVVRLGTSVFRITPSEDASPAEMIGAE
ncbi:MAG TPA: tetratricopeptide repeat protein [Thermohalobaculum sp.]|nr:tetratricopeptide repeat protein [Thermohalobaculum sp.]